MAATMVDVPDQIPVRDLLISSPYYFINKVFGYSVSGCHDKMLDFFLTNQHGLLLCPRGSGKSKIAQGYVAWLALHNPDMRILIVSDSDGKARLFLNTIKNVLEYSPIVLEYYGDVRADPWTEHAITIKGRSFIQTEPTVMSVGSGSGRATGLHVDLILMDDIESFDSARSGIKRSRLQDWYKTTLSPCLLANGKTMVCATRYHYADIYSCFINEFGFDKLILPAIDKDGKSICDWLLPLHDIPMPDGSVTKGLNTIREELGPIIYSLQYQNDVELMKEGNIFKHQWFRYYDHIEWDDGVLYVVMGRIRKRILKIYIGGDPAITTKDTRAASFTAIVIIGQDDNGMMYVIDYVNEHLTFGRQKKRLIALADKYHPIALNLEDVAYQKALIQELRSEGGMNVIALHPLADKVARANTVTGFFESHKVYFQAGHTDLTDQLLLFPDGDFDDLVDATVYALQGFKSGTSIMFVVGLDDD